MAYLRKKSINILIIVLVILLTGLTYIIKSNYFGIPVLNYHLVSNREITPLAITPQEFDEQMAYLYNNGYTTISPDQLLDYIQYNTPLPEKPVLITFDDGYRDMYTEAYPILKKYNFTATIFLITDYVENNSRYLTWDQVREMQEQGLTMGSHTLNHVSLSDISDDDAAYQLAASRDAIAWRLKKPVKYFAYPGGFYKWKTLQLVEQAGYRAAFTVNFGKVKRNSDEFALNRIPIFKSDHTFRDFWLRLKFTQAVIDFSAFEKYLRKFS